MNASGARSDAYFPLSGECGNMDARLAGSSVPASQWKLCGVVK